MLVSRFKRDGQPEAPSTVMPLRLAA
jgi:hypothetical protein